MEGVLIAFIVIGILIGCVFLATTLGSIFDETALTETQTVTFDSDTTVCDAATSVGSGACNARVDGLAAERLSLTAYTTTATKQADACDTAKQIPSGTCNGKVSILSSSFDGGLLLGGLLVGLGILALLCIVAIAL